MLFLDPIGVNPDPDRVQTGACEQAAQRGFNRHMALECLGGHDGKLAGGSDRRTGLPGKDSQGFC